MKKLRFTLFVGILFFAACATTGKKFEKPTISLVDIRPSGFKILETSALVTLRVYNENPYPIELNGGVYNIYINGRRIGKGISNQSLRVPRLSSVTEDVTIHIGNLSLGLKLKNIFESKKFDYKIKGKTFIRRGSGTRSYYFTQEGKFDLDEILPEKKERGEKQEPLNKNQKKSNRGGRL